MDDDLGCAAIVFLICLVSAVSFMYGKSEYNEGYKVGKLAGICTERGGVYKNSQCIINDSIIIKVNDKTN